MWRWLQFIEELMQVGFFFQAEDGIRELVRSRGLGDVYKRQDLRREVPELRRHLAMHIRTSDRKLAALVRTRVVSVSYTHLTLPTIYPV